jgi:hypothetical protein
MESSIASLLTELKQLATQSNQWNDLLKDLNTAVKELGDLEHQTNLILHKINTL